MTVKVTKPAVNVREKLSELDSPILDRLAESGDGLSVQGDLTTSGKLKTFDNGGVGGSNYSQLVVEQTSESGSASLSLTSKFTNVNNTDKEVSAIKLGTITNGDSTPDADIRFETINNGSLAERMRIDSSGDVGIGESSPSYKLHVKGDAAIQSGNVSLVVGANGGSTALSNTTQKIGRIGTPHYTNSEEPIAILMNVSDPSENILSIGGNTSSMNAATRIGFFTAANTTTVSGSERMRITSSGNVGIGESNPSAKFEVLQSAFGATSAIFRSSHSTTPQGIVIDFSVATPDNNSQKFLTCEDATAERCVIYSDGDLANHDGTYGTLSDRHYKTDIQDARSYWEDWKDIQFHTFTKGGKKQFGVIADELETVFPSLVHTSPDENHPDGESQWVDTMNLLQIAGKVIQELQEKNEALEARITALES